MHDLIHADHFYRETEVYQGQLGFYGLLDHCIRQGHFTEHLKNEKFAQEFEYVISDMNAYAVHLMKCLKSALIHFHTEGEMFFKNWVNDLKSEGDEQKALLELNKTCYQPESQDSHILNFLNRWKFSL
jgi:hypothetical protein